MTWTRRSVAAVGTTAAVFVAVYLFSSPVRRLVAHLGSESAILVLDRAAPERLTIGAEPHLAADLYRSGAGSPQGRPLLLLVHGSSPEGGRHPLCRTLAEKLAGDGFPVLSLDLRGFGGSDPPPEPLSENLHFEEDVRAAALYAIEHGLAQPGHVVYVGHSLGAAVVLRASRLDPPPAAVVALSVPSTREMVRERTGEEWRQFAVERLLDMHRRTDEVSIAAMERTLLELDPEAQHTAGLPAPVLLVFGAHERGARNPPPWEAPHQTRIIPDAGHDYSVERGPLGLRYYDRKPMRALLSAIERWAETWAG